MTVLPRTPVDPPVNPLQSQTAAAGRSAAGRGQLPGGAEADGETAPSFSTLLGSLRAPAEGNQTNVGKAAPLPPELQRAGVTVDTVLEPQINPAGEEITSLNPPAVHPEAAVIGTSKDAPALAEDGRVRVDGVKQNVPSTPDRVAAFPATTPAQPQSTDDVLIPTAPIDGAEGPRPQAASNIAPEKQALPTAREIIPGERRLEAQTMQLASAGAASLPGKAEEAAQARPDLATIRVEKGAPERTKDLPRARSAALPAAPAMPAQPAAELAPERLQIKPAAAKAEFTPAPVQPADPVNVNVSAVASATRSSDGAGDELPRLQEVKVLSSRVIETAPASVDRTGQGTAVKVIDLQLQPDTLGRIGAQLKRTGEGLEVRLEPSLAETALMLKEDRLALQRILGALGPLTEPTVVRIVEPVTEQRQTDGQDPVASFELGEADQGGAQSAASEDLRREGALLNDLRSGQADEEDAGAGARNQRASDDIYI